MALRGTPVIALSPDGATLAFVGQEGVGLAATPQLYVRRLDQLRAMALAGTERAVAPVFSPDGQWIAFFAGGKLKNIAVSGGAAVPLCDVSLALGAAWTDDGSIVFTGPTGLLRVSSAGGQPERLTALVQGEALQLGPQVIADGKAVLFTSASGTTALDGATVVAQALPAGGRTIVQRNAYGARYLPSGHLLYSS